MTVSTFNASAETYFQYTAGSYPPFPSGSQDPGGSGYFLCAKGNFGGTRVEGVGLLTFDTSAIPDGDTITSARIIGTPSNLDRTDRNLVADYYDWGATPDSSDFTQSVGTTALTSFDHTTLTVGVEGSIPMTGMSGISKTGTTYLRFGMDGGYASDIGANRINLNISRATPIRLEVTHAPVTTRSSMSGLSGLSAIF